ncbi:MAG TPA: 23S rRNA (pseudouridine(1915)-N(3))-methyltransferase RlmH [Longimicrobiaceae bacterium]|nr:23S rRNA (pseudouridine(1915)-N(3))-methyltransferase RlmH [Longimicrobiaceae bacterium]
MKLLLLAVGKARGAVGEAVAGYEARLRHYFAFESIEVKEEPYRREGDAARVRDEEGKRLLAKVPAGAELVALHEAGKQWTSEQLARYLSDLALRAGPGAAFALGGAYGLADEVLRRAGHTLSLSAMTLPHELARLVLTEQLYRAGTIARGEPYHKGREP